MERVKSLDNEKNVSIVAPIKEIFRGFCIVILAFDNPAAAVVFTLFLIVRFSYGI